MDFCGCRNFFLKMDTDVVDTTIQKEGDRESGMGNGYN